MMQPLTTSERKCVIKGCGNISMFKQSHQFPSMPDRCAAWLRAIGNHLDDDLIGQPHEKFKRRIVCVDHFELSCISAHSPRFLKRSAVPTIFNPELSQSTQSSRAQTTEPLRPPITTVGRPRQQPVTYRTIVIPKNKQDKQRSFYINKTSEPSPAQPSGPTLLIEPLASSADIEGVGAGEETEELPMFYMSSQHSRAEEQGKPALKVTKVYPNRKPQNEPELSSETNVETMLIERGDFPVEYLEDWDEQHLEPESPNSEASDGSQDNEPLILEAEHVIEGEDLKEIHDSISVPMETDDWTEVNKGHMEMLNNNILQQKLEAVMVKAEKAAERFLEPIIVEPTPRCMESTPYIPNCVEYLLLGGGTASVAAFRTIQKHDPNAKIMIVSKEYAYPYRRQLLSKPGFWDCDDFNSLEKAAYRRANGEKRTLYHKPESFYTEACELWRGGGVSVARGYTVRRLDAERRTVVLSAPNRSDCTVQYGSCMIATGSRSANIPVLETASAEVLARCVSPRSLWDARELRRRLEVARTVVVVGGGYLGTETACCLAERVRKLGRQVNITHIFREGGVMWNILPDYLSRWSMRHLTKQGINVFYSTEILNAYMKNNRVALELSNAEMVEADLIVVCVGSVPNTDFAAASGLEVHSQLGGIIVNTDYCVRKDLYAAGDVACYYDSRLGRRRTEHARHAVQSGRTCALRMCGLEPPARAHTELRSHLGRNLRFEAIGIVDSNLEMMGAFPNLSQVDGSDKNYNKGVVFYLQQREIVGVLMWNLKNRMRIARKLLSQQQTHDGEINELADLFIDNSSATEKRQEEISSQPENAYYQCHHCDQRLATRPDIIQHLMAVHPHGEICEICQKQFPTRVLLKAHHTDHLNGKLIASNMCPELRTSKGDYSLPMRDHGLIE